MIAEASYFYVAHWVRDLRDDRQPLCFYTPEVMVGDAKRHGITVLLRISMLPASSSRSALPRRSG